MTYAVYMGQNGFHLSYEHFHKFPIPVSILS